TRWYEVSVRLSVMDLGVLIPAARCSPSVGTVLVSLFAINHGYAKCAFLRARSVLAFCHKLVKFQSLGSLAFMVWTTIITGIGGLLVMVASMLALREHLWLRNAQVTEGTVAELIAVRGSKGTTYKPRVRYIAQDGNVHEFVRRFSSSPPGFSVGEKVP